MNLDKLRKRIQSEKDWIQALRDSKNYSLIPECKVRLDAYEHALSLVEGSK